MSCPNPYCDLSFPDQESICFHLSQPETPCWQWTTAFMDFMMNGKSGEDLEEDDYNDDDVLDPGYEGILSLYLSVILH